MYGRTVGPGAVVGAGLARTGFPLVGLAVLALALLLCGFLLLRAGTVRRGV